ncbi:hypothetical protein H6G76_25665 [Nostoc sp. FACHB-152]|uniref:hypothetical protein n=1 Tax=unclassified Nostoc TaxID=2593658 RepID=UPI00168783D4|nr:MULTISPECIES: hypothetical protein [unclassified Nostoc]MBD2450478.1 hypothetical protein [Nostoc sp. FACHB-152]MBD2471699.1 hypothetical protein [Nostoc sp. FACHB-145]
MNPDLLVFSSYIAHIQNWNFGQFHIWFPSSLTKFIHSWQLWWIGEILLTNQLYQEVVHQ